MCPQAFAVLRFLAYERTGVAEPIDNSLQTPVF
jgi:hypothetical protein